MEMDDKSRNLLLLTGLSLFCAGVAWISSNFVLGWVFIALGAAAALGISREALGLISRSPGGRATWRR
jgi:hypothetical protein